MAKITERVERIQDRLDVLWSEIAKAESERDALESELEGLLNGPSVYGFLYDHSGEDGYERDCYRVYKAHTLAEAATKMAQCIERKGWQDVLVDSEADNNGKHVDLYQIGEAHLLYQYLP